MNTTNDLLLKKLGARLRERDFDERMANAIATRILSEHEGEALVERTATRTGVHVRQRKPARVLRFGRMQAFAAPLAIAAAVVLFLGVRQSPTSPAALPTYDVSVVGAKTHRAVDEVKVGEVAPSDVAPSEVTLDPNGDFELVARPKSPSRNVVAHAAIVRDGKERPWLVPIEVSHDGAVRIVGQNKALFAETRGTYEVILTVEREGARTSSRTRVRFAE